MRPLEIIIPLLGAAYLLWPPPRPLAIRLAPAIALLITLAHFAVDGYRWQMIPIYVLTPLLALGSLAKITGSGDWPAAASYWTFCLLVLSTALPALLPVPKIAAPGGEYRVGTTIIELTDASRKEQYSGRDEPRRFLMQVWYPANITESDRRAPWMPNANIYTPAIATYIDLPPFFLDHLALVEMPAYQGANIAHTDNVFPVVLFSHGWNGFNAQNTGQAIEMASHGYVVAAVQHTYGAVITVFPDGTVAPNNPNALPKDADDPNYEVAARRLADQWAGDISFALDQLESLNSETESIFFQKLYLERVGIYGHSTGGGAAIQFCGSDPRCRAVLGMDPFMRPVSAEVIEQGVSQPSFFMFSQSWADDIDSRNNKLFSQFRTNIQNNFGVVTIDGTKHYDFSDLPLLSPIAPQLGLKGPLNGKRVTRIVNSYLLDFFEMALNNKPSELFDGSFSDFSEVKEMK